MEILGTIFFFVQTRFRFPGPTAAGCGFSSTGLPKTNKSPPGPLRLPTAFPLPICPPKPSNPQPLNPLALSSPPSPLAVSIPYRYDPSMLLFGHAPKSAPLLYKLVFPTHTPTPTPTSPEPQLPACGFRIRRDCFLALALPITPLKHTPTSTPARRVFGLASLGVGVGVGVGLGVGVGVGLG